MKAAVIAGGGSYGAYTVGRLFKTKPNYQVVNGCSTGALMAPLVALEQYDKLKDVYTSVTAEDIFSVNPFDSKGNLKIFNALWRLTTGKKTLGETQSLYKLIQSSFPEKEFNRLNKTGKKVIITVCNISKTYNNTEYVTNEECSYENFIKFMLASASVPLIGSIVEINGQEYVDGGTTEALPLLKTLQYKPQEVDCYLHDTEPVSSSKQNVKNIFNLGGRVFNISKAEMQKDNLLTGLLQSELIQPCKVRTSYLPQSFPVNALVFNEELMTEWFNLGYNTANDWK